MIQLFGANASGATLLSLDDPRLDTDRGATFIASMTPADFDLGPEGQGMSTLRQWIQQLTIGQSATVVATPMTDGVVGVPYSENFIAADGGEQQIEVDLFEQGRRATVVFEVTAHVGVTELGDADQEFIPRRSLW